MTNWPCLITANTDMKIGNNVRVVQPSSKLVKALLYFVLLRLLLCTLCAKFWAIFFFSVCQYLPLFSARPKWKYYRKPTNSKTPFLMNFNFGNFLSAVGLEGGFKRRLRGWVVQNVTGSSPNLSVTSYTLIGYLLLVWVCTMIDVSPSYGPLAQDR